MALDLPSSVSIRSREQKGSVTMKGPHKSWCRSLSDRDPLWGPNVDTIDTVEGVCNGFLPYTRFLGFPEFSGYHQWQQESQ